MKSNKDLVQQIKKAKGKPGIGHSTKRSRNELTLIVTNLEYFASNVESKLADIDWHTKREIIRVLVKRIEIGHDDVNVVFRVIELPGQRWR